MDPRQQLVTFPLNLGMDNVSFDESVQPAGARPRLVMSRNTRLTKVPGCVSKAPGVLTLSTLNGTPGGAIPAGREDSTLVPSRAAASTVRVAGGAVGMPTSLSSPTSPQNGYYPAQVTRAGVVPGSNNVFWNASCAYESSAGWTYFITLKRLSLFTGVYLSVLADDGRVIVSSTLLLSLVGGLSPTGVPDDGHYAGITAHGSTLVLWYAASGAASLLARTVAVNTSTLAVTLGTPATIYSPVGGIAGPQATQIANDPIDSANAYVAIQDSVTATSVAVLRVDIPGLTVAASATYAAGSFEWVGIAYKSGVGLLFATSAPGSQVNLRELNTTTLAATWTQLAILDDGVPSLGFQTYAGTTYRVISVSRIEATQVGTLVALLTSAGTVYASDGSINQQTMVGHVTTLRHADGTFDALIPAQVCYQPNSPLASYDPASDFFVGDPSVEVYRALPTLAPGSVATIAMFCVARIGVDLAIRYPGSLTSPSSMFLASSSSCIDVGSSQMLLTYVQENLLDGDVGDGYSIRYAALSLAATQPRVTYTADGAAIVAGALPAVWDGAELTEYSPLRQPKVTAVSTGGGSGAPLPAGSYLLAVVLSWRDASGLVHRSAPSNTVTLDNGVSPVDAIVKVYLPESYRNLLTQSGFQVVVYVSEVDGVTPYATQKWQVIAPLVAYDTRSYTFIDVIAGEPSAFRPPIYTDGSATQELAAFCPNACIDATVISDRLWLLDAELPRWWFSKSKASGVFLEMSPDLKVDLPSNAGIGVATSEMNGSPLFLTSRGIWTVGGEGPDALNQPPDFSSPVQVSDVACTQRLSVVKTPVGVMFVSNSRFVRFSGQIAEYPDVDASLYGAIVGTALFRKQQECVFFTANGYAWVFNWLADAWTLWDTTVTGLDSITGCAQRSDGKVLLVGSASGVGTLNLLNPDSVSGTSQIVLETGWITLGGPQDNNTISDLVLHAKRAAAHGLSITMAVDYLGTPTVVRSWTAAEVLSCVTDATTGLRYDLYPQLPTQTARAVKLTITETGSSDEAFVGLNMTVVFKKHGGKTDQSIRTGARK